MWVTLGGKHPQRQSQVQSPHPLEIHSAVLRRGILCFTKKEWGTSQESLHFRGVHRRLWVLAASVAEHLALKLFTDHLQGNQIPHWKHGLQSVRSGIKTMKTPLVRNLLFWALFALRTYRYPCWLASVNSMEHPKAEASWWWHGCGKVWTGRSSVLFCCCFHRWTEDSKRGVGHYKAT